MYRPRAKALFENFQQVLRYLGRNQGEMRDFFGGAAVAFLLVSSPKPEALEKAFFFEAKARGLSLPLAGYVPNRMLAWRSELSLAARSPGTFALALLELLEGASEPVSLGALADTFEG